MKYLILITGSDDRWLPSIILGSLRFAFIYSYNSGGYLVTCILRLPQADLLNMQVLDSK